MKTNKRPLISRYKFTIINPTKTVFTLVLEPNTVHSGNPTTRDFNLDMNKASFNLFMIDGTPRIQFRDGVVGSTNCYDLPMTFLQDFYADLIYVFEKSIN